jgi:hypothetical protein
MPSFARALGLWKGRMPNDWSGCGGNTATRNLLKGDLHLLVYPAQVSKGWICPTAAAAGCVSFSGFMAPVVSHPRCQKLSYPQLFSLTLYTTSSTQLSDCHYDEALRSQIVTQTLPLQNLANQPASTP